MDRASTTMDAGGEIRCKDNFIVQTYESPSPNSLGFSSFLCVLCVKFLTSPPGKSFNTEDTEKRGEMRRESRAHFCASNPGGHRDFNIENTKFVGTATIIRKSLLFAGRIGENRFSRMLNECLSFMGELA